MSARKIKEQIHHYDFFILFYEIEPFSRYCHGYWSLDFQYIVPLIDFVRCELSSIPIRQK